MKKNSFDGNTNNRPTLMIIIMNTNVKKHQKTVKEREK